MTRPTSAAPSTAHLPPTSTLQRRTVGVLAGSQVLGGVGVTAGAAVGSLLATELSGSERWAGLGGTGQVLGGALIAMVLAPVMAAYGRRRGLALGYLIALVGALLIIASAIWGLFSVFLVGSILFGGATATNSQARFAATDLAEESTRGRHLSIVVWATTVGAVAGPNLTGLSGDISTVLGINTLAAPYALSIVGLVLAVGLLAIGLRPDPLITARSLHRLASEPSTARPSWMSSLRNGVALIMHRPAALLGVLSMALGHAVMVSVMGMTPIHMHHGQAELEVIGLVISLHILGMFAFSPITGWAVDRFGGRAVACVGAVLLLAAGVLAATSAAGSSLQLTVALFILGLGWSCTLIAGSTLLTSALSVDERPAAQGLADVAMGLAGGGAGAIAGVIVHAWGYPVLAVLAGAIALTLGLAALRLKQAPHH